MFTSIMNEIEWTGERSCHILGFSLSRYLALRNSLYEKRIDAITMLSTPIYNFFQDFKVYSGIPKITRFIIKKNIEKVNHELKTENEIFDKLKGVFPPILKIRDDLKIFYIESKYDEVIPSVEKELLEEKCRDIKVIYLPDVHGAPSYHKTVVLFILWSVFKTRNVRRMLRAFLVLGIYLSENVSSLKKKYHKE